jgi:serine/threonine-protein kinase
MTWSDLIGSRLDRYEITGELGRGGSSRVYRAFDPKRQGEVAIKVIPNDAEDRQRFVRRFKREARVVQQLKHPNIIEIFDSGQNEELVYLVMQCVLGGTLRQHFAQGLPLLQAIRYIRQIAFALHHAHEQKIIHRDVKPSNMLVEKDTPQHILLTDFGIAKIQGSGALTKSGTTIGTPEYMSPEQAEGREVDRRSDIYSLGCVLYEALAHRPPFVGATPLSVLYQHVHTRPPYVRGFNPDVPLELTRILECALAKEPEDRFETAEIFAYVLEPFSSDSSGTAANRMTEVPLDSPDVLSGQGLLPGSDVLAPFGDTPGASLFFVPDVPSLESAPDLPASERDRFDPDTPRRDTPLLFQGDMATMQGRPPPHPLVPTRPLRMPARPSGPIPPDVAALANVPGLQADLAEGGLGVPGIDIADLPTAIPGAPGIDIADLPTAIPGAPGQESSPSLDISQMPTAMPAGRARGQSAYEPGAPAAEAPPPVSPRPARRWDPATDEIATVAVPAPRPPRKRRRPALIALVLAAVVLASVAALVGYTTYAARNTIGAHGGHAHSTPSPSPSPSITPTATTRPTVTPTTNPNAALDAKAAASFRAIYLGTYEDQSCSSASATTHFAPGQEIWANLCTSGTVAPGSMTAVIRQNGVIVWTMTPPTPTYLAPEVSYNYYETSYLEPGAYDLLVTIDINGHVATAKDQPFRVG